MIGYKRVGYCAYPTLTGHTLRSENVKLIQLVKAIKSNIKIEKKLNNTSGGKGEVLRESKGAKESKEVKECEEEREKKGAKESKEGKESEEERENKDIKRSKEEEGRKEEKEINEGRKNEENRARERESSIKINCKQEQTIEILEDRPQFASDDHHDVLDVD